MKKEKIVAVILAAGKGSRMDEISKYYPKPIIPVFNKPLIQHQIDLIKSLGIKKVFVVIGYLGYKVVECLKNSSNNDIEIIFIEQEHTLGIAHAVIQLEKYINSPFLLFLGDIFFVTKNFPQIISHLDKKKYSAVLAVKKEPQKELLRRNFAVFLNAKKEVIRVVEKPRYVKNNLKGTGIYLFQPEIFDAIRRTPRTAMRDEYEITDSIQILINDGYKVGISNCIKEDMNVTFPEDIIVINNFLLKMKKMKNYIADGTKIPKHIKMTNSVIGKNVIFKSNNLSEISNSFIADNSQIDGKAINIRNRIITPELDVSY